MKRFFHWSLQKQLFVSLGSTIVLVFLISIFLNFQATKQRIISESRVQARESISEAVRNLISMMDGIEESTRLLANVAQYGHYTEAELQALLENTITTNANIYGGTIALVPKHSNDPNKGFAPYYYRTDNGAVAFSDLADESYQYESQVWFANAALMKSQNWSSPYYDEGGGNTTMTTFTVPVFKSGEIYAVVTGDLDLSRMNQVLQSVDLGETGSLILLDHTLQVMSSRDPSFFMKGLPDILQGRVRDQSIELKWQEVLEDLAEGESGFEELPCPFVEGLCLVAFLPIEINQWPLLVVYPVDEIYEDLAKYTQRFTMASIIFLMVFFGLILFLTRQMTKPLKALAEVAEELGQGDFNATLPNHTRNAETRQLRNAFFKMQKALSEFIEQLKQETATINRLEGELNAATQIQMSMLPGQGSVQESIERIDLWAHLIPAKSVGGDLYQYRKIGNKLVFIIGDVSDKGVAAALFMASTVSYFKDYAQSELSAAHILSRLNQALEEGNDACMFVTAFLGVIDLETLHLEYAVAGHNPPLLLRGSEVELIEGERGAALGLMPEAQYSNNQLQLQPGDRVLMYTDGVDEAFNPDKEQFGEQRLIDLARKDGQQSGTDLNSLGQNIFDSVSNFSASEPQSDDITVLLIDIK